MIILWTISKNKKGNLSEKMEASSARAISSTKSRWWKTCLIYELRIWSSFLGNVGLAVLPFELVFKGILFEHPFQIAFISNYVQMIRKLLGSSLNIHLLSWNCTDSHSKTIVSKPSIKRILGRHWVSSTSLSTALISRYQLIICIIASNLLLREKVSTRE